MQVVAQDLSLSCNAGFLVNNQDIKKESIRNMNYTYANVGNLAIVDDVISSISPSTSIQDSNPNDIPTCGAVKEYVDSQQHLDCVVKSYENGSSYNVLIQPPTKVYENKVYGQNGFAYGESNVIGSYGFRGKIISYIQISAASQTINGYPICDAVLSVNLDPAKDELKFQKINQVKPYVSIDSSNATTDIAKVISVDFNTHQLAICTFISPITLLESRTLYFRECPECGLSSLPTSDCTFTIGYMNGVNSWGSFAQGAYNRADGNYAFAHGKQNTASWGATAIGCANRALGECAVANGGRANTATRAYSYATGTANRADAEVSHVAGYMARAKDQCSFVWNGEKRYGYQGDPTKQYSYIGAGLWELPDSQIPPTAPNRQDKKTIEYVDSDIFISSMYTSHGTGSFNINPQAGISGFYIGEHNLHEILESSISAVGKPLTGKTYTVSSQLSTLLFDIATVLGAVVNL